MLQKPVDSLEATKPKQSLLMPFDGTWKCMIKLGEKGGGGAWRKERDIVCLNDKLWNWVYVSWVISRTPVAVSAGC